MDPLSITGTVLSLTAQCLSTAKALNDLRTKLQYAEVTISAICSECTVISVSLTQIQNSVLKDPNALATHIQYRPELETTFDTALTGCKVVLAVLDNEVQKLYNPEGAVMASSWKSKARLVWNETTMKELLLQLRGQQTAMTLLIQCLQLDSSLELHALLRDSNAMLTQLATRTRSLRQEHPMLKTPRSIFDNSINDVGSIYSGVSGATEFDFDEFIFNSRVYRRAFVGAFAKHSNQETSDDEDEDDGRTITPPNYDEDNRSILTTNTVATANNGYQLPPIAEVSSSMFDSSSDSGLPGNSDLRASADSDSDGTTLKAETATGSADEEDRESAKQARTEYLDSLLMENQGSLEPWLEELVRSYESTLSQDSQAPIKILRRKLDIVLDLREKENELNDLKNGKRNGESTEGAGEESSTQNTIRPSVQNVRGRIDTYLWANKMAGELDVDWIAGAQAKLKNALDSGVLHCSSSALYNHLENQMSVAADRKFLDEIRRMYNKVKRLYFERKEEAEHYKKEYRLAMDNLEAVQRLFAAQKEQTQQWEKRYVKRAAELRQFKDPVSFYWSQGLEKELVTSLRGEQNVGRR